MSFNSPSDNHETKHDPNHPAGTPQSPETGGDFKRVPADSAQGETECAKRARIFPCPRSYIHPAYANGDWGTDVARLRAESYARACRSRAAVLCASTDAEDALALAIYACQPAEAFANGQALYRRRYRRTEDPS